MPRPHDMKFAEIENNQVVFVCANCGSKIGMSMPNEQGQIHAEQNKSGEWTHPELDKLAVATFGGPCNS